MTISGTPMFMAPEQTVGDRSLDARADIYALGAVMYHALTGQPPFAGENAFAIMMAHSRDPVVPPVADQSRYTGRPRAGDPPLPGEEARRPVSRAPRRSARRWPPAPRLTNGEPTEQKPGGPPKDCSSSQMIRRSGPRRRRRNLSPANSVRC